MRQPRRWRFFVACRLLKSIDFGRAKRQDERLRAHPANSLEPAFPESQSTLTLETYRMAKPFRCNIYKKQGGGVAAAKDSLGQPEHKAELFTAPALPRALAGI